MNWDLLYLYIFIFSVNFIVLVFSEFLIGTRCKKRKFFFLRLIVSLPILLSLVVAFCFVAVFTLSTPQVHYSDTYTLFFHVLIDAIILVLSLSIIQFCYDCDSTGTIVIAIIGYNASKLIYCLFVILSSIYLSISGGSGLIYSVWQIDSINNLPIYLIYLFSFATVSVLIFFLFIKDKDLDLSIVQDKVVFFLFIFIVIIHLIVQNFIKLNIEEEVTVQDVAGFLAEGTLSFVILLLQFYIIRHFNLKNEKEQEEQRIAIAEKNYHFTKDIIEQINIKAHDLKHQIRELTSQNKIDNETASSIRETIAIYDAMAKTNNETINVVLSEKWIYCNKHGISFSVIVDSDVMSFMKRSDIYSLLGNALDNAIEASLKLPREKRAISLVLKNVIGCVSLQITNNFKGKIKKDARGVLKTIKEDESSHGFGFKSMQYIVGKYGGEISYFVEGETFTLQSLIPIQETE